MPTKFLPGSLLPVLLAVVVLGGANFSLYGQSAATAVLTGTVTDPQGAVVPDASVSAHNIDTGTESSTVTTANGLYRFPNLPPGTYDITVAKQGFSNGTTKGIQLNVGDYRDLDCRLQLTGTALSITVTTEAPLLETTRTDVSTVVDEKQMRSLPVTNGFGGGLGPSNDYATLATTAPGVRYDFSTNSLDLIGPGAYNYRDNIYNVDGANITDQLLSGRDALGASLDEVKEFQVLTNNYNAEYGQAGGLIINVITKSGTNNFHGDAHAYFRGRNLSASNYFYNLGLVEAGIPVEGAPRAPFQKQEWGATTGGPFVKNRTFWFGSFEKTHQSTPLTLTPPGGNITVGQPVGEILWSAKLDHKLTAGNQVSLRFNQQRQTASNQLVQVPQSATPESLVDFRLHDHTLNGRLISTIAPELVNEAHVFWHRNLTVAPTRTTAPGIKGPNFYHGAAFCCPQAWDLNRYEGVDNLSWTHGTHTLKTGISVNYFPYTFLYQQYHFGRWEVDSSGVPLSLKIGLGPGLVAAKDNIYGAYVQDTWKIWRNFTMNYGLRYDYEAGAFRGGPLKIQGEPGCFQSNGVIPSCSSDKNNLQPRIGLSWSPNFARGPLRWLFSDGNKSVISASFSEVTEPAFLSLSLDSLIFDGATLRKVVFTQPPVLAFYPNLPPTSLLTSLVHGFGEVRPISNHLRNPEDRHLNLSIRRELTPTTAIELDYIGVFGFGQFGELDTNFPPILADPAHPGFFYFGSRPNQLFNGIRTNQNSRTSHYNGFLAQINRRFASHVQFQANYTWSKTLTSTEDFYGTSEPADPRNIRAELGPAEADSRHTFNFSAVFDTTKLATGNLARLLNDWSLAWTGTLQSGRPYPVSTGDVPFADAFYPGIASETQQRPNALPGGTLVTTNIAGQGSNLLVSPLGATLCGCPASTFLAPANADPNGALDTVLTAVGQSSPPVDFQFVSGNVGRNAGEGSRYALLNVSLMRSFALGRNERRRLEFKADFFNVLNHTNFLYFNTNDVLNALTPGLSSGGAAIPNCTSCLNVFTGQYIGANGQPLRLQDLKRGKVDSSLLNPNWALIGDPAGADIPRQIQLAVRVRW